MTQVSQGQKACKYNPGTRPMHDWSLREKDKMHTRLKRRGRAQKIQPFPYVSCTWLANPFCSTGFTLLPAAEGHLPSPCGVWNKAGVVPESYWYVLSSSKKSLHVPHTEEKDHTVYALISLCAMQFLSLSAYHIQNTGFWVGTQGRCLAPLRPIPHSWHFLTCGHSTPVSSPWLYCHLLFCSYQISICCLFRV